MRGRLVQASRWWVLKLANMTTLTREWVALQNAVTCPFSDIILTGRPR
jgi:hypothetical protein